MVESLDAGDLDEILVADRPAVIEAWAPGCGACHQIGRVLALLSEHAPGIDFYRLDVSDDGLRDAVTRLGITAAPTVLVWHRGRERARSEGAGGASGLWDLITRSLQGEGASLT